MGRHTNAQIHIHILWEYKRGWTLLAGHWWYRNGKEHTLNNNPTLLPPTALQTKCSPSTCIGKIILARNNKRLAANKIINGFIKVSSNGSVDDACLQTRVLRGVEAVAFTTCTLSYLNGS